MAIYTFRNKETDEAVEFHCNISEYDELVQELGDEWERVYVPLRIVGDSINLSKTDDGWNDVLKRIKASSGKKNSINTK